ncbi:MAG: FHA domain-containing protein [Pseudobdellovibrionaceae bacterium]
MALFLEIIEGPQEGQKFRLIEGLRVGRTTGEIQLSDPKVSSLHAQIESSENGQLFLVDRGSSNGIRINGNRVQRAAMLPGVRLQIGKTLFRVVEIAAAPSPLAEIETTDGWKSILKTRIPQAPSQNLTSAALVQAFQPLLQLEFLEGLQAETKMVLGYGPRKAGSDVLDIELQEPSAPDIAFELFPEKDGSVRFLTAHPDLVLLNDSAISSDTLKSGDQIRIGSSLIEVKFLV